MKRAWWLCALVAACRVNALEGAEYVGPKNRCEIGCPSDAQCIEDRCVADQTSYPLLLDATPPLSALYAPGVTFTVAVDDKRGGARDLKLPETATVVATLVSGTAIPLLLRLERVGAVPGVAAATYEAKSIAKSTKTPPLSIPPGDYFVFVSPAEDSSLAQFPPVQLRGEDRKALVVTFASGPQELQISYAPESFRTIEIEMQDSTGGPLTNAIEARDIRVIDETTGRLASTVGHTCATPGTPLSPSVKIQLAPELADHRYTLRISPAAKPCSATTVLRSTIDFDLQALDVEGHGNKVLVQVPQVRTVFVRGIVRQFGTNKAIEGDIVLRSVKLDDDSKSGRAWSTLTLPIDRDGTFRDIVLPGTYRADIIPTSDVRFESSKYAICVDCTVPSQDPMAKPGTRSAEFYIDGNGVLTFEVPPRVRTTGSATGFDNSMFTVGTWQASTSTSGATTTLAGTRLITRAQSGLVKVLSDKVSTWNIDGTFDPGVYDLVIRTPEASGYPWIVRPRLEVAAAAKFDLATMAASAPVVLTGKVTDPAGAPIPRATIRARAYISATDPKKPPLGAVLVGETRADDNGNYRLVVPSALTVATNKPAETK
jgi:hypothetical protein